MPLHPQESDDMTDDVPLVVSDGTLIQRTTSLLIHYSALISPGSSSRSSSPGNVT